MPPQSKSNKNANGQSHVAIRVIPGSIWGELKTVKHGKSGKKSAETWMENPEIEKIREFGGVFVNDKFIDIWDNDSQLLFLEGSYGSSKTTYAITRLLVHCMQDKVFKCFYGRQQKEMARQLHSNIIREIERNHWEDRFDYSKKPNGSKSIFCLENGNCFELFGCDDEDTLKGIDNPTHILVDEVNQIDFNSFGMLITRLRTSGANLQFIGCFNPCDVLPSHWIVKYIYAGGKTASGYVNIDRKQSFTEEEEAILEALEDLNVLSHHSTYLDNYFQNPDAYYKKLIVKAGGDKERVKDYAEGRWGAQLNAQPYYKNFKSSRDVYEYDEDLIVGQDENGLPIDENGRSVLKYIEHSPLLFSFDENVQPYLPALIAQRHGDEIWFIDEIAAENPYNNIWDVTGMVKERFPYHKAGMRITGDATAKKESTITEEGQNFFTMIHGLLSMYSPDLCVPDSNPNNKMRGLFINIILKLNYGGVTIKISKKCKKLIEDMENCMEALDASGVRTGKKDKSTKMVNGVRNVQPYGHLGDCLDYLMCNEFLYVYALFQNNGVAYDPSGGGRTVRNSYSSTIPQKQIHDSYTKNTDKESLKSKIKKTEDYSDQVYKGEKPSYNNKFEENLDNFDTEENERQKEKHTDISFGVGGYTGRNNEDYDLDEYRPIGRTISRNKMI